jgi:hypothetical protein
MLNEFRPWEATDMRCKNCHTVMADIDTHCVSCGATAESATAAPPALTGEKPNGLLLMLPLFGGLLGGLIYAGLVANESGGSGRRGGGGGGTGAWKTIKTLFAMALLFGGGLFMAVGFFQISAVRDISQRDPTTATATDLRMRDFVEKPPFWVSYTFEESKPIEGKVKRQRKGHGGEVEARCILVRVEHKWLFATVAEGFEGNELVGQIMPMDSPVSKPMIDRLRDQQSDPKTILPYEFYAVEGCPSDQTFRYTVAGWIGGIGLTAFVAGLFLLFVGRQAS